jgi:hypothetical protein
MEETEYRSIPLSGKSEWNFIENVFVTCKIKGIFV